MKKTLFFLSAIFMMTPAAQLLAAAELRSGTSVLSFPGRVRDYATTAAGGSARESFQAEITVTVKSGYGGNGCAFIGLGNGKPDPKAYGEPTQAPSLVFRMAPNDFGGGRVLATVDGQPVEEAQLGDGTHRLRLSWDAAKKCAWLEIHRNWKPGALFTPAGLLQVPGGTVVLNSDTRLFVGGAEDVLFADFTLRGISPEELARLPSSDAFPKDASSRTWLPVDGASSLTKPDASTASVDRFIKDLSASFRPVVCWYKGASLTASRTLPGGRLELPNSKWALAVNAKPVEGEAEALDLTLSVILKEGGALSAGVAAAFDFSDWTKENYTLIPASLYNGNRLRTVNRGYSAGLDNADYYRKDLPLTQGDLPRLEVEDNKPSKVEVNASNVTTPAIGVFDPRSKRGFIVLAEQAGRAANGDFLRKPNGEILDNAFAIEESLDRSRATVVIAAPGVRERKPEFLGFSGSPDRAVAWRAGDCVTLNLRVYSFAAADIPALLEKFMAVRKALTGPNHPRKLVPASQTEKYMTDVIDSRFLVSKNGSFYCPENGDWIAFGWVGGWINTFSMLVLGDEKHLDRVTQTFDFGFKAQEPSGYFHYAIRQDGNLTFREPRPDMNQSRTMGDTLFWMIKQFNLLKAQNRCHAIKPEWEVGMRKLADAFVATWKKDGQWGKMINVKTGSVSEYNTTGGAPVIQGLAYASAYFHEPEYLKVAMEAAKFYYTRDFVKQGFTTGGCADILQNADSETAAALMSSLMALYEVTGDQAWLEKSRQVAHLVATWTVSYDYELPKFTELGSLGAKLAGVYWASTQNKHGAPGICTSSGDSLFKIYRATGDTRYAELIRDIVAAHGESIRPNGRTNERLTYCDADSRGSRGDHVTGWNETNGALMAQELPGIYLQTDADCFYVFDAVEAKVLSRAADGVRIAIRNPTKFDARVAVFAESAKQAKLPQGTVAFLKWPKVEVKAGKTVAVRISPDNKTTASQIESGKQ